MKSDKSYKKTKDLKTGDSIQPFYSRISNTEDRINGYEMILEDNGKWEYTHRIVKRKINPNTIGVCHHKDFNKLNNEPENLQVMDYFDHQKYHASLNSEKWNNEDFANKMRQIFSETNSKNGPYWSDPKWREKRVEQARKTTIKFQSTLTEEEKRKLYGLPGDLNGMYNNGKVLIGEKNGRYKHDLKHEFTTEEIINAYKCTKNIDEACELLNTNKIILRKSNAYKSLAIDRWEDLNILLGEINFENLNRECEKYKSEFILERNFRKICKLNNWNSKVVTKFLQKNDFSSWNNYVEQFDSRTHCINKIKDLYINHTNVDNGISFKTFCDQHNLRPKQVEGAISRSKHKNWSGFLSSINHSIKEIVFVGQEKTYDLINVSDNNNYAILSSNGTGVFVHNCVTRSDRGEILSIYSENTRIKKILKSLFSGVLNIDFNLWFWIRELLKYGDNFLKLEIDKENGVYDVIQLPTGEIDKKIGTDKDPREVQYIWRGNSEHRFVEWQVAHFSLISDGRMMPFGRSILDPARKLWKQLQLAEDAMLVYRLVRAPERRIFYLEVGNSDPADIKQYIESMKRELKKSPVVDQSGNVNMKFNLVTFEEDYFIPIRGDKSSRIETLPGASNLGDIADIEYLQNKLFTAIKVPKTYLNYGEALPGGSTLSQADLRFSRTINRIQEAVVLELRRIANIHLILLGFDDDVDNFTLTLTNPSTQQELLKLETMKARNDVFKEMFSSDATSPVSYAWGMEFILGFSKSEIKQILRQKKIERKIFYEIERAHLEYMDTGLFTELDKKFRKPDFDPNTEIDPETGEATGGEGEGGGGGSALQNPLGSLGNFDLNNAGGGGGESPDMGGDFGGGASAGVPSGAELAGADEPIAAPEDNMNERNTLLKKNNQFNFKTKSLLEGIEHYLNKIKHNEGDDNIELTQDDIDKL